MDDEETKPAEVEKVGAETKPAEVEKIRAETKPAEEIDEEHLPVPWRQVQTAIWLIGLAFLFWQDWIFPGILVLIAISGLTQAFILWYVREQQRRAAEVRSLETRRGALPENCPKCGGPLHGVQVRWSSPTTAVCPYCGAAVRAVLKSAETAEG